MQCDGEERIQFVMIEQLDFPIVLLIYVIPLPQLSSIVGLHDRSLKDASDMLMAGNSMGGF